MASFALRMSTQIRISLSGLGMTTRDDVHSVGPHGTSSMYDVLLQQLIQILVYFAS